MPPTAAAPADELLALSRRLLDSIDAGDWETYTELCAPDLTAFEPEAVGHLVEGMPFHGFYFDRAERYGGRGSLSSIASPRVRLLGPADDPHAAVVTYVRLVQSEGPPSEGAGGALATRCSSEPACGNAPPTAGGTCTSTARPRGGRTWGRSGSR